MTKALVTGIRGFIGSNLVNLLQLHSFDVAHFDLEDCENRVDSVMRSTLESFLTSSNPEVIFHVGANSNTLDTDVNRMFFMNYEISKWVTDWAVKNSRIIIYSSSAAGYGTNRSYPSNLYGWSKYAAEDYVRKSGGVSLRYFNVYGPGESHKQGMASFVNQAFHASLRMQQCFIFPGEPRRDFVHVSDVCDANLFAFKNFESHGLRGGVFDVGSGQSHTFEEALSVFEIEWQYLAQSSIPLGYQMFTQAREEAFLPGWQPKIEFEIGMRTYKEYLEAMKSK